MPVGIRFRMCSQATTTGAMVACSTRAPTGAGGLPRLAVIVTRTTCAWVVAVSTPRITLLKPTGSLSAASPTPHLPVGIRFRMYTQVSTAGTLVTWTARTPAGTGGLPQPTVIVARTTWSCIVAVSTPRITTMVGPSVFLSAAPAESKSVRFVIIAIGSTFGK